MFRLSLNVLFTIGMFWQLLNSKYLLRLVFETRKYYTAPCKTFSADLWDKSFYEMRAHPSRVRSLTVARHLPSRNRILLPVVFCQGRAHRQHFQNWHKMISFPYNKFQQITTDTSSLCVKFCWYRACPFVTTERPIMNFKVCPLITEKGGSLYKIYY